MAAEMPDDVRALFERPNIAHVATLMPDGSPHAVPVWVGTEGERVCFFTQDGSRKARNLARDGRVAISIVDHENPYRMAQVRGRVAERWQGDRALPVIDRLSQRYTGRDFPMRTGTVFLVEPEHVFAMTLPFEPA